MRRPTALFAAWIVLFAQLAPAQQDTQIESPTQTPGWGMSGIRGWLERYKVHDEPPINLRNTGRLESLVRAGRLYLSLNDAIALALENNLDIEVQRYAPRLAEADLLRARAGGLIRGIPTTLSTTTTNVANQVAGGGGLGTNVSRTGSTASSDTATTGGVVFQQSGTTIPILDPVASVGYGFFHATTVNSNSFSTGIPAFAVRQQTPYFSIQRGFLTGTNMSVDFNNQYVRSTVPRAEINPYYTGNLGLTLSQSLLRGFGTNVNNRNIRIAKIEVNMSDLVFKQQVITTLSGIINIYWDLVSYVEDAKVKKQALALAEKLLSDNKKQVEIGTLAPIEVVRAEAEVARNQQDLIISETRVFQQETVLKNALSRTGVSSPSIADARIVTTDSIRIPDTEQIQPIQDMVNAAIERRPDIQQARMSVDSTKIGLEGSKSQLKPDLSVQAQIRNKGLSGSPNLVSLPGTQGLVSVANPYFVGGYGGVIAQIFRRNFPDYNISFNLNIPLHNRSARADMANDLLRLRQQELRYQAQINQVRVDVQNAIIGLQQARATYQSSVKARIFAEQTLDAEQKKYALGASTIFVVIQSQRDLAVAQAAEVAALSTYSRAKVQLDQAIGVTLDVNNVSIDEAKKGQVSRSPSTVPMGQQ